MVQMMGKSILDIQSQVLAKKERKRANKTTNDNSKDSNFNTLEQMVKNNPPGMNPQMGQGELGFLKENAHNQTGTASP